ncbi:MAG: translocation/assembly module TamB [Deltaproteobacteria bacterium]|nr:translocation/assembly module TamB [Deltaproteobacteria bacterium]
MVAGAKRVARGLAKLVGGLLLAVLVLVLVVVMLLGNDSLLTAVAPRVLPLVGFELHVGLLAHDLGRRIEIRDATFGTPGEEPWVRVDRLVLRYSLAGIASGRVDVPSLTIEKPRVRMGLAEDGTFQWPPTPGKATPSPLEPEEAEEPVPPGEDHLIPPLPIGIHVGEVELGDGFFELADHAPEGRTLEVEGISLRAGGVVTPSDLHATLDLAEVRYGRGGVGPLHIEAALDGDLLRVARVDVTTPDGGVHVEDGTFEPLTLATHAKVHLDRVRLEPIVSAFTDVPELPGPLTGDLTLDGVVPDDVKIGIERLDAAYLGETISLAGHAAGSFTDYEDLSITGSVADLRFTADGRLDVVEDGTAVHVTAEAPSLALADSLAGGIGLSGSGLILDAHARGPFDALVVEIGKLAIASAAINDARFDRLELTGTLRGTALDARLGFADLAAPGVSLGAGWLSAGGTLAKIEFALGVGGAVEATGSFDTSTLVLATKGTIRELRLEPFLALGGIREAHGKLGSAAFHVAGPVTDLARIDGAATLNGLVVSAGGVSLAQRAPLDVTLAGGQATAKAALALGRGSLDAEGMVGLRDRTVDAKVVGQLEVADLAAMARPFAPMIAGGAGSLEIRAKLRGRLDDPGTEAFVSGRDLMVQIDPAGTESASSPAPPSSTTAEPGKAPAPGDELASDAAAEPTSTAAAEAADGAAGPDAPAAPPAPPAPIEARMRILDFGAAGDLSRLYGTVWVDGGQASAYGRKLWDMSGLVKLDGGDVWVNDVRMALEGVWVVAYGSIERDGRLGLNLRSDGGRVEAVSDLTNQDLSGALDIRIASHGTLRAPVAEATITATDLFFRERPIGELRAAVHADGSRATASIKLPGDGEITAESGLAPGSIFTASARVRRLPLDPGLKGFQSFLPPPFRDPTGFLAFDADLAGPIDAPASVKGTVVLNALEITGAEQTLGLAAPCTATIDGTTVEVGRARLVIGGGYVEAAGRISPDRQELDLAVDLDPALAEGVAKGVEIGHGRVVVKDGQIVHDASGLSVVGSLRANLDAVTVRGLPDALRDVEVAARFDGRPFKLERAFFRMGDGDLIATASGDLARLALDASTIDFHALPYRMPKTVRVATSGKLSVTGDAKDLRVGGRVRIDEALYERDVEVLQGLIKPIQAPGRKTRTSSGALPVILDAIHLDVTVVSGEDLVVRNNVARLAATADLNVKGTAARPQMLGQVRVGEGTVRLFGRVFSIETGTIDFSNPIAIDPDIHIGTKTTIDRDSGSVDVLVDLEGTVSKGLALKLSSSPSYTQDDIVFLLATGKTREEIQSGSKGSGTSMTGAALMAVSLLGGDRVKESLGLEEIGLEEGENGGARVSVAKRLGVRVTVRAINEIGGKGKAPVSVAVEYQLLDRVLLVATPQSNGAFGAEVRFRFLFR